MAVINFIKGIFIGIALVIPGLSGSLFAVVVGLYDKLLEAINSFRKDIKKYSLFLLPIVLGVAVGILGSAKLILWVCEEYTLQSYSFFVGLVLGSIPSICEKIKSKKFNPSKLLISFLTFAAILLISFAAASVTGSEGTKTYISIPYISGIADVLMIIFAGAFSCALMAIPGVSGSIMLMLINQYGTVYNAASKAGDIITFALKGDMHAVMAALPTVAILIPFVIGAAVGIILIAKLLAYLLKKFEAEVYYGVMGIVVGAVGILFKDGIYSGISVSINSGLVSGAAGILIIAIFAVAGYFCTNVLDK